MDDPPPPDEAIAPMPQAVEGADRPGEPMSLTEAAGPRIMLQPGGTLQGRAILSDEARFSLKSVLQEIKGRILPGILVTDQEFRKWIDMVYADNWLPGYFCKGGDDRVTRRTTRDCAYTVGTLREDLQMSPRQVDRAWPRSFLERELERANAPRATQWWRQAGAPVHLFIEHNKEGNVSFSFRDHEMAIIHRDTQVNYIGDGATDAYLYAMRQNDEFMTSTVHGYNIAQGVYICRNRLTHWSNPGICAGQMPPSEHLYKALSEVKLCRNIWDIQGCPVVAKIIHRSFPPPKLFP